MPVESEGRVQHWRMLATDALASAARASDEKARRLLLEIAVLYERLAARAEDRGAVVVPTVASVADAPAPKRESTSQNE